MDTTRWIHWRNHVDKWASKREATNVCNWKYIDWISVDESYVAWEVCILSDHVELDPVYWQHSEDGGGTETDSRRWRSEKDEETGPNTTTIGANTKGSDEIIWSSRLRRSSRRWNGNFKTLWVSRRFTVTDWRPISLNALIWIVTEVIDLSVSNTVVRSDVTRSPSSRRLV